MRKKIIVSLLVVQKPSRSLRILHKAEIFWCSYLMQSSVMYISSYLLCLLQQCLTGPLCTDVSLSPGCNRLWNTSMIFLKWEMTVLCYKLSNSWMLILDLLSHTLYVTSPVNIYYIQLLNVLYKTDGGIQIRQAFTAEEDGISLSRQAVVMLSFKCMWYFLARLSISPISIRSTGSNWHAQWSHHSAILKKSDWLCFGHYYLMQ